MVCYILVFSTYPFRSNLQFQQTMFVQKKGLHKGRLNNLLQRHLGFQKIRKFHTFALLLFH